MKLKCVHDIVWNDKTKIMTFPKIEFGYCTKCNKSCQKINGKIIWEK